MGYSVAVVGATGNVGREMLGILAERSFPADEIVALASRRSQGVDVSYGERTLKVKALEHYDFSGTDICLMSAGAAVSKEYSPKIAAAGAVVIDNSSAWRYDSDVPLIVPEVNADHVKLVHAQRWRQDSGGFVVTNPNCSAIGLVMALAPLQRGFGLEKVMVVTMQAVSGAGYPGVASLDILGNVIPYIAKEEEKMEEETRKLLGHGEAARIRPADFAMSAHCNRVAVEDGHTESVSVKLKRPARAEEIIEAFRSFRSLPQELRLPNAPEQPLIYDCAPDHPQPRFDVDRGAGMSVSVGRLRPCGVLDWKFTVLSHNTIRGAAGAALLNAELLKAQGYLGD